jgi:hypothetical protein
MEDWLISQATWRHHYNAPFGVIARDKTTVRQRAVWRFVVLSLAARRKGDVDIGCVVATDNATRSVLNQPPSYG